jgi:hypothetical protein
MHWGLPHIQVAAALHFDFSGYTPLSIHGLMKLPPKLWRETTKG